MAQSSSSAHWQKKGFGWIPDLPDIADPSLTLALDNKPRILSREGTDHLEGITKILSELLQDRDLSKAKQLEDVYNKILGETRFPNVQVYKILRKPETGKLQEAAQVQHSHAKEIIQLKQALYWIYRGSKTYQNNFSDASPEEFKDLLPQKHEEIIEWLQTPVFDDKLEEVVKDFQKQNKLVEDGIVGLRTYIVLKAKLANPGEQVKEQNVELLCPSSIIPHDILEEVFQQLTYIWLCTKFSFSIDQVFEYFFGQYSLSQHQSESAVKIKIELQSTVQENLKEFSPAFRKKIKLLPTKRSDQARILHEKAVKYLDLHTEAIEGIVHKEAIRNLYEKAIESLDSSEEVIESIVHREAIKNLYKKAIEDLNTSETVKDLNSHKKVFKDLCEGIKDLDFHTKAVKDLKKKLINLKELLVHKSYDLTSVAYQELDQFQADIREAESEEKIHPERFEGYPPQPVRPIFEELHKILEASLNKLGKSLCDRDSEQAVLDNSFIIYSDEDFIEQFHTWFHIIEPFVSAIFQILSPLASFDNYRQAVGTGFDKLESCFQLHQLEHSSKVGAYKNLLIEYTPVQTIDQIEKLQELRKTIVDLFQETIAKINRIRGENLNYRPHILSSLEKLLKNDIEEYFNRQTQSSNNWQYTLDTNELNNKWLNTIQTEFLCSIVIQLEDLEKEGLKQERKKEILEEQRRRIRSLSKMFLGSRLKKLSEDLSKKLEGELSKESDSTSFDLANKKYKKICQDFIEDELSKDRKDIDSYFSFFDFFSVIIDEKYRVRLKNVGFIPSHKPVLTAQAQSHEQTQAHDQAQAENSDDDEQKKTQAELISFLTSKKELFEIQNIEDWGIDAVQVDRESRKSLFFEPTVVQLPINANLMKKAARPVGLTTSSSSKTMTSSDSTRFYFFLPGLVDLSYWCPPIEDQEDVNACTAFAGVSLLEYFAQKRYGKYTNLSARFLYKTARNLMNRSDDTGASVRQTMKALVLFGVPPEEVWPWHTEAFNEEPPAFCYAYAQSYQALKYFRLDAGNSGAKDTSISFRELLLFQIKAVLAAGLPCIFGFTVYSSFFKDRNIRLGHIPYPSSRDQVMGGHSAVAVGYNDYKCIDRVDGEPNKTGAILIRNSWGSGWGNGGYGWIPYEYVLEGLTADWWSLLKSEWFDGGAFGLGAVDPGTSGGSRWPQ